MKRAIVTGGTGVIGMALIHKLIAEGVEVLVFCSRNSKRTGQIPQNPYVTIRYADLKEYADLENETGEKYDVFYHLAWAGTTGAQRNDLQMQTDNIRYAIDAVEMAKRFGCDAFVGVGSQAEYGRKTERLVPDMVMNPETGYGIAKLCAGHMTRQKALSNGVRHLWVRVLSVYGPYDGMGSLINYAISELIHGRRPELTKGEQVWDYLYSEDAAEALYRVGEMGKSGRTYVLGSGNARSLSEYLDILGKAANPEIELVFGEKPYADQQVMYLTADISGLRQDTGFVPQVSFEDGIKRTVEWVKSMVL